jgi:hypothetical protein
MEDVGDAVALEHVGEAFRPGHSSIVSEHHGFNRSILSAATLGLRAARGAE